jgi:hypothetical protein
MSLVGKTIASDEEDNYGVRLLRFTDGGVATLGARDDYGDESYNIYTAGEWAEHLADQEEERRQNEIRREQQRIRAAEREQERGHAQATLSPSEYEQWLKEHQPTYIFSQAMKECFTGAIRDLMNDQNRILFGGS